MVKKLLSILLLSVLMASTLVGCSQPCTLTILSITGGSISVIKAGTDDWIEAEVGMSLEVGDSIKTGDDSSAEITFIDGSTIELQAGTEIEVDSLATTDTDSATIVLKQTIGSIIFRVTKIVDPASRYEVETPVGVVAVRGSIMQVYVTEDGTTWATNLEGDIWASAQGVELQVPEGRQCIIRPDEPPELEVTFADPNLEAVVRDAIAIPEGPIYASDLAELAYLSASLKNITDLTGLEYATSLTVLSLSNNQISDISPLAGLTSLERLWLYRNEISDISPLGNLTRLTHLFLTFNYEISDISPLVNLTHLTNLGLSGHQISDISLVVDLSTLTFLDLQHSQIDDISALASLTGLARLWLNVNQISDISPLANLTELAELGLSNNQISDISPLANLTSLTELSLMINQIGDISPLASLTNLTRLDLADNQITDISPLVENPGLGEGDEIDLRYNALSEQSVNEYIPALEARGVTVEY
jgi:hypothetical protein